ncbi:1-acyl-sn-glycerol-3-phosphate acyltransferase [Sphingobacterium sp. C459-1T]|uniref:1-acyl-sn-glycerol-3-phosphate acyltransferase n=1 Tax=Sphingobacterium faecale TaxID=2803775 RepID=A0ABS1QZJ2_9SPHI|nr:1-acyl-sn-glycerol-3-phosphate acyltransferase [Sphingobacterium faecale]
MVQILKKLHRLWYFLCLLIFFILLFPLLYLLTRNPEKNYAAIVRVRRIIALLATTCSGIFFKVEFESEIDWSIPYIICPNHTSILDITAIIFMCPQPFSFMGKVELLRNPVTRIFFKTIDIAVDRKSKISAFRAFKKADSLVKEGKSMVIFPEGKIDDEYPPKLHEFKSGSFKLAIDNQIQILPVVIQNAWQILWDGGEKFGSRPGTIQIKVLTPISTQLMTTQQSDEIQTLVYHRMQSYWTLGKSLQNVKNMEA